MTAAAMPAATQSRGAGATLELEKGHVTAVLGAAPVGGGGGGGPAYVLGEEAVGSSAGRRPASIAAGSAAVLNNS